MVGRTAHHAHWSRNPAHKPLDANLTAVERPYTHVCTVHLLVVACRQDVLSAFSHELLIQYVCVLDVQLLNFYHLQVSGLMCRSRRRDGLKACSLAVGCSVSKALCHEWNRNIATCWLAPGNITLTCAVTPQLTGTKKPQIPQNDLLVYNSMLYQ